MRAGIVVNVTRADRRGDHLGSQRDAADGARFSKISSLEAVGLGESGEAVSLPLEDFRSKAYHSSRRPSDRAPDRSNPTRTHWHTLERLQAVAC